MNAIFVSRRDIPKLILEACPTYRGRSFRVCPGVSVCLSNRNWGCGSKSEYMAVSLDDGRVQAAPSTSPSTPDQTVEIPPRVVVVERTFYCGEDMGVTIYVRPEDYQGLLPEPVELSETEQAVLRITWSYKAAYRGEARYEAGITPDIWEQTKTKLHSRGLMDKRGALTQAGKNAVLKRV
jgi:hypothetical protein